MKEEQSRVDIGLVSNRNLTQKRLALKLHLLPYLEQHKKVLYTNQIGLSTFRDYEIFSSEATPLTRNGEITHSSKQSTANRQQLSLQFKEGINHLILSIGDKILRYNKNSYANKK